VCRGSGGVCAPRRRPIVEAAVSAHERLFEEANEMSIAKTGEGKRVDVHEDGNSSDVWRITGQRKVNAEDIPHDTIHRILRTANLSVALS
jgi:hypothetical protein